MRKERTQTVTFECHALCGVCVFVRLLNLPGGGGGGNNYILWPAYGGLKCARLMSGFVHTRQIHCHKRHWWLERWYRRVGCCQRTRLPVHLPLSTRTTVLLPRKYIKRLFNCTFIHSLPCRCTTEKLNELCGS